MNTYIQNLNKINSAIYNNSKQIPVIKYLNNNNRNYVQ